MLFNEELVLLASLPLGALLDIPHNTPLALTSPIKWAIAWRES